MLAVNNHQTFVGQDYCQFSPLLREAVSSGTLRFHPLKQKPIISKFSTRFGTMGRTLPKNFDCLKVLKISLVLNEKNKKIMKKINEIHFFNLLKCFDKEKKNTHTHTHTREQALPANRVNYFQCTQQYLLII